MNSSFFFLKLHEFNFRNTFHTENSTEKDEVRTSNGIIKCVEIKCVLTSLLILIVVLQGQADRV